MQRYFLQLSYNGKNYNGWQIQKNTPHTIQQVMQETLGKILPERQAFLTGCGRTDTGVHAEEFFAHFDTRQTDLYEIRKDFLFRLNRALPHDISIKNIFPVTPGANSRYGATSRVYEYRIAREKNVFLHDFCWYIFGDLNFDKMKEACSVIEATTDFCSFAKSNDQPHDNSCAIREARLFVREDGIWVFRIEANRFLRNMVRALVGTLVNVGKERTSLEDFQQIIASHDRSSAGMSAPAQGLFLVKINYPPSIFLRP